MLYVIGDEVKIIFAGQNVFDYTVLIRLKQPKEIKTFFYIYMLSYNIIFNTGIAIAPHGYTYYIYTV